MARMTVYLPDDLYQKVKASNIKMSWVCQMALKSALACEEAEPEGAEVMHDVYKWLGHGRMLMDQLQGFLA